MQKSYGHIFKSTAFTGGAAIVTIGLGIVRTKVLAIYLGTSGVGFSGVYTTIASLVTVLAGMGIASSGVRMIAEAAASGDDLIISRTIVTLRRTAILLAFVGLLIPLFGSKALSQLTFGDLDHVRDIALLGIVVFVSILSAAQSALLQGLRRIEDLSRVNVYGALAATAVGLPILCIWRQDGLIPFLIVVPAALLLCSWCAARRITIAKCDCDFGETSHRARLLLRLGMAFMASSLMAAFVAYVTRIWLVKRLGIDAAGNYTAAYTLAGVYAGFILQAMGTDFYPRLTAVAGDHPTVNRFVNEQTEVALLVALPGILITLLVAPFVIRLFYSSAFGPAAQVLQWLVCCSLLLINCAL